MKITTISTKELAKEAAKALNKELNKVKNKPYLLMLSGGSSLSLLDHIDTNAIGSGTTITVLDERHSSDEKENNFSLIMATSFYDNAKLHGAKFIDTRVKGDEGLEEHGARFERDLRKWHALNPGSPILATIGIGSDGHVAGMMPYPDDTSLFYKHFQSEKWAVGYNAGGKNPLPLRVTVTIPFIRDRISFAVSYISGEEKRQALENILTHNGTLAETPARILSEMKEVGIFTNIKL